MTDRRKHPDTATEPGRDISRRDMLRTTGAAGAAAFLPRTVPESAILPDDGRSSGAPPPEQSAVTGPMMNLTAAETEILSAMIDRLIPSDDLGPGALEAGVLRFIDRALSEAESGAVEAYRDGLAALDRYSEYTREQRFVELPPGDQDSVMIDLDTGGATGAGVGFVGSSASFFNMVKSHTWQGMFGDPRYGGNVDFAGWDLIRYPGVRMRVTEDEQRRLEADELPPVRRSAYDYETFRIGDAE